jgi:hypothetical protein
MIPFYSVGSVLGSLKKYEESLELLETAVRKRMPLCFIFPHHPIFDTLRSYPPLAALINTMGAPTIE